MKKYYIFLVITLLIVSCQTNNELQFFEKIIGEWHQKDLPVIEKWKYSDGTYNSQALIIRGNDTTISEEVRIIEIDGAYYYEATVVDQNEGESILFKLIESTENKVVFENPEHDFPQKITYELINEDLLNASVVGIINGKTKSLQFEYSKIN